MIRFKHAYTDLLNLLFPALCNGCGLTLYGGEKAICAHCLADLPYTDFHLYSDNLVAKQFWGRLPCDGAMAMLYFKKGSKTQNLIHHLKYKGQTEVGYVLGSLLGEKLALSHQYKAIDCIVPVPLHLKKERSRGYNQSRYIADGIAHQIAVPINYNSLFRKKATKSQTQKSRYTRYENMQTVFQIDYPETLKNKHVLLVDDVITTGATLEACGHSLLNSGVKKLSIATLAFTK